MIADQRQVGQIGMGMGNGNENGKGNHRGNEGLRTMLEISDLGSGSSARSRGHRTEGNLLALAGFAVATPLA
jgi:hypothetical protein